MLKSIVQDEKSHPALAEPGETRTGSDINRFLSARRSGFNFVDC